MFTRSGGFAVLLPVKSPGTGKSRLTSLSPHERARLAAAFATDVVDACLATPGVAGVLVVSDDDAFAASLAARGAAACSDPGGGLNAALRHGADVVRRARPDLQPVALCADLPALRPADLASALEFIGAQAGAPCFVRDADETGTTLYTARYDDFDPRFGVGSAAAHTSTGARPAPGELVTLRRDVDDADGLTDALAIGLGTASLQVVSDMTNGPHSRGSAARS